MSLFEEYIMTTLQSQKESIVKPRRFTRSEYHGMADLGFFEGEQVELIEGEIVMTSPQKPRHSMSSGEIADILSAAFGPGYFAMQHSPLSLSGDSEPEPDVAIIKGNRRDFMQINPAMAELVVEVSLTRYYSYDSGRKASIYARAGIPEYWILNLLKNQLEVLREPQKVSSKVYRYSRIRILLPGSTVSPLSVPKSKISVSDLFLSAK
jgi:Uma2 family endonuclease